MIAFLSDSICQSSISKKLIRVKKEVKLDDVQKGANANTLDREIKRGTIISLEEGSERRFVIMVVSAKLNNKWFSSRLTDKYPKWPFEKGDEKKYRFEVRDVVIKRKDNKYVLKRTTNMY